MTKRLSRDIQVPGFRFINTMQENIWFTIVYFVIK